MRSTRKFQNAEPKLRDVDVGCSMRKLLFRLLQLGSLFALCGSSSKTVQNDLVTNTPVTNTVVAKEFLYHTEPSFSVDLLILIDYALAIRLTQNGKSIEQYINNLVAQISHTLAQLVPPGSINLTRYEIFDPKVEDILAFWPNGNVMGTETIVKAAKYVQRRKDIPRTDFVLLLIGGPKAVCLFRDGYIPPPRTMPGPQQYPPLEQERREECQKRLSAGLHIDAVQTIAPCYFACNASYKEEEAPTMMFFMHDKDGTRCNIYDPLERCKNRKCVEED